MANIIKCEDIEWTLNKKENVWIGFNPHLETRKVGIYYARLEPGQELVLHKHNRPEEGDEIFFFYQPGNILYKGKQDGKLIEREIDIKRPMHMIFKNQEPHGIKNIGDESIEFELIYAPKFKPGEVIHL